MKYICEGIPNNIQYQATGSNFYEAEKEKRIFTIFTNIGVKYKSKIERTIYSNRLSTKHTSLSAMTNWQVSTSRHNASEH